METAAVTLQFAKGSPEETVGIKSGQDRGRRMLNCSRILITQSVVLSPATSASLGSLLEMQILKNHPRCPV